MNSLIEVSDLHKYFPSGDKIIKIIMGLDMKVDEGEMIAIIGASGVGKTTLLNLLGAMDKPDKGSIKFEGREITTLNELELAHFRNYKLGFIFQFYHLLPEFSALENTMFPFLIRGQDGTKARKRALQLLKEVGLEERSHHHPFELSGGERQRVAIARALMGEPKLILADEPTGNLDAATGWQIFSLLRQLHENKCLTSVIVTHNLDITAQCNRRLRLKNGALHPIE